MNKGDNVSIPTLERLPKYCTLLKLLKSKDVRYISSTKIAKYMQLKPIQVRKDISQTGIKGKPKIGYKVDILYNSLIKFLGWKRNHKAIIIGCGNIGMSLLKYKKFQDYNFEIIAGFENNNNIIGKVINDKDILDIDMLPDFLKGKKIEIGIIAVNESNAQCIADKLVKNGIKAIWNFAPVSLEIDPQIIIQQQDMTQCIAFLTKKIDNQKKCPS